MTDLTQIAEGDAHARWIVEHHVSIGPDEQRQRCPLCEEWWPCDLASLASLAMLRAQEAEWLRAALQHIAADWHRRECPEDAPCDCHEETARAALTPPQEAASDAPRCWRAGQGGLMSVTFIAIYRGQTISSAKLIATSVDPTLVEYVAARILGTNPATGDDPVLIAMERRKRAALRAIRRDVADTLAEED